MKALDCGALHSYSSAHISATLEHTLGTGLGAQMALSCYFSNSNTYD